MKFALTKKCCLNIYIYIYIYIERERERERTTEILKKKVMQVERMISISDLMSLDITLSPDEGSLEPKLSNVDFLLHLILHYIKFFCLQ